MRVAPDGDAASLPLESVLVACQIVPVVFVKKYRLPVDVETGSAQTWYPEASSVAPLHAVVPVALEPVIETI